MPGAFACTRESFCFHRSGITSKLWWQTKVIKHIPCKIYCMLSSMQPCKCYFKNIVIFAPPHPLPFPLINILKIVNCFMFCFIIEGLTVDIFFSPICLIYLHFHEVRKNANFAISTDRAIWAVKLVYMYVHFVSAQYCALSVDSCSLIAPDSNFNPWYKYDFEKRKT